MKAIFFLSCVIICISCNECKNTEHLLLGKWHVDNLNTGDELANRNILLDTEITKNHHVGNVFDFSSDCTFSLSSQDNIELAQGSYKMASDGSMMALKFDKDSDEIQYKIEEKTGATLFLTAETGGERIQLRITKKDSITPVTRSLR